MAFNVTLSWQGEVFRMEARPREHIAALVTRALKARGDDPAAGRAARGELSLFDSRGRELLPDRGVAVLASYPLTEAFTIRPGVVH